MIKTIEELRTRALETCLDMVRGGMGTLTADEEGELLDIWQEYERLTIPISSTEEV